MSDGQSQMVSATAEGEPLGEAGKKARNYFLDLLPDAMHEMRRLMKNSDNEKLVASICKDVVELAGAGIEQKAPLVVINDSDVRLLLNVTREVLASG